MSGADAGDVLKKPLTPYTAASSSSSLFELHQAAADDDMIRVNQFLDNDDDDDDPNLNIRDDFGQTPLHVACKYNNSAIAAIFAECGADVNAVDNDGNTPLHLAAIYNTKLPVSMVSKSEKKNIYFLLFSFCGLKQM
jgi:ankyrin repeat protein